MAVVEPRLETLTRKLERGAGAVRIARLIVTLLFGAVIAINLVAVVFDDTALPFTHLATALLAGYVLVEARLYLRRTDAFGLLSPGFMALIFHFLLAYMVGATASAFEPRVLMRHQSWLPEIDAQIADTMLLAMLAAFCMLRGAALAQPLARKLRRKVQASPQIRREIRPHLGFMIVVQLVYLGMVAYAIELGVYGLLGTAETRAQHLGVVQFLNLLLAAGTLSYFLILLVYFDRREQGRRASAVTALVVVLITLHVVAGALSAFKSQIVFPFVIAGFAYFLATRRIPTGFIAAVFVALVAAYAIVEPFRAYLGQVNERPASLVEAVDALSTAYALREQYAHYSDLSRAEQIAQRFDLAGMTTLAVDYVDRGALQASQRRDFQDSILLAPVLAYVPRAVWAEKPIYTTVGSWFNQNVRGNWQDESTSVGMGPIGYLYMAGGIFWVAIGFFGFGLLQALIFDGIARGGAGGLIIYLGVAGTLVTIPSSFGPAVVGVLRMLPIAFLAQMILLRGSRSRRP